MNSLMRDNEKLEVILDRFYNVFNKYNSDVLKMLGEKVKQFDGLTPSEAHKLAQEMKYSTDIRNITRELSRISGKSMQEIDELLDRVAKENIEFAETYFKDIEDYEHNDRVRRYVETIKKETKELFKDLSKTKNLGFTLKDRNGNMIFTPFEQAYKDLIDKAVYNVSTGVIDYQSAMRNTLNQLANSGVKIHEEKTTYESGYQRRIDSSVRQAILTGMRKVNMGIQEMVGKEFGANGVEISYHFPCADDHIDIQGRQYSNKQFEKLNANLMRPIGELNCTHFIFSIILGVNEPNESEEYLNKLKRMSKETITYKGKEYTPYEATQVQRKLETAIRRQKDRQIISRASGDDIGIMKAQKKITQLTTEYYNFSKKADLDVYKNRMVVSGYNRLKSYDKK